MKADEPIHPVTWEMNGKMVAVGGLTVRDHTIIENMKGLLANPNLISMTDMIYIAEGTKGGKVIIGCASKLADGMIEVSNK